MNTTSSDSDLTLDRVQAAVNVILETLGKPENDLHTMALTAFQSADHQKVKRLALINPLDDYCKALGYLGGALKLTPNTDTILAESARVAADFVKEKTLLKLGIEIEKALTGRI